jgi:hypothetical protein
MGSIVVDTPTPAFDVELAKQGLWEKDDNGLAKGDLHWNIVTNLDWLALQSTRPDILPCGVLTGVFLNHVARRFEKMVLEQRL